MVRTQCFYFGGPGSIPGLGTKICKLHDVAKNKKKSKPMSLPSYPGHIRWFLGLPWVGSVYSCVLLEDVESHSNRTGS